jgi:peroxiredoxin
LRDHYDDIRTAGADVVAVGTGNQGYASAFVRDERIPFTVLVDDHGDAARAAAVRTVGWFELLHPRTWRTSAAAWRAGHRIHRSGARVTQLGGTFVVGPGDVVRYSHVDNDSTDHAPLDDVLAAVRAH